MVDPNALLAGRTRETRIRRDDAGRWFDGDDPITHPLLTRAFDAWLVPAPDGSGRWCLSNDINWAFVALEGPPRFVRSLDAGGETIVLHLSDETRAPLAPETLRQGPDGALYCDVAGLAARFDRHAAMQLAERLGVGERGGFPPLRHARARPPTVDDPLTVR